MEVKVVPETRAIVFVQVKNIRERPAIYMPLTYLKFNLAGQSRTTSILCLQTLLRIKKNWIDFDIAVTDYVVPPLQISLIDSLGEVASTTYPLDEPIIRTISQRQGASPVIDVDVPLYNGHVNIMAEITLSIIIQIPQNNLDAIQVFNSGAPYRYILKHSFQPVRCEVCLDGPITELSVMKGILQTKRKMQFAAKKMGANALVNYYSNAEVTHENGHTVRACAKPVVIVEYHRDIPPKPDNCGGAKSFRSNDVHNIDSSSPPPNHPAGTICPDTESPIMMVLNRKIEDDTKSELVEKLQAVIQASKRPESKKISPTLDTDEKSIGRDQNVGIPEVLKKVEIKDEGLVKTAISAMLLESVNTVGSYTPPASPQSIGVPSTNAESGTESQSNTGNMYTPPISPVSLKEVYELSNSNRLSLKKSHVLGTVDHSSEKEELECEKHDVTPCADNEEVNNNESQPNKLDPIDITSNIEDERSGDISDVLKTVRIREDSLVKTAMQAMLLVKVGVIGTCTPPVSPRSFDDEDSSASPSKQFDKTNAFFPPSDTENQDNIKNRVINAYKQKEKVPVTPTDVKCVEGIPDAIHNVEIKDESLVKTAVQAMLLDRVGIMGTYTPPTSPMRSGSAQFSYPMKKITMPKSASHVNFTDYVKKQSRETVLGVPFTSIVNLRAEILKRQQSQPCFFDDTGTSPPTQPAFTFLRNGQNRMSDTQLDKPIVRSMLNESLEKKKHKYKCFHLNKKKLFSFLHKNQEGAVCEKKENKGIISRIFHRKSKDEKHQSSISLSSSFDHQNLTNTRTYNSDPSYKRRSVHTDHSTISNHHCNNTCITPGHPATALDDQPICMHQELRDDITRRSSDFDVGVTKGVSLIGLALARQDGKDTSEVLDKVDDSGNFAEAISSTRQPNSVEKNDDPPVTITSLSHIPGCTIERYLGNLTRVFILNTDKEDDDTYTETVVLNLLTILKAHVRMFGGNCLVSLFFNASKVTRDNTGECLIAIIVGGDVGLAS